MKTVLFPALLLLAAVSLSADPRRPDTMARLADDWTVCGTLELAEQYTSHASEQAGNGIGADGLGVRAPRGTRVRIIDTLPGYSQVQVLDGPSAGYVGWIFTDVLERN